ncbi:flagellar motor switch protein FliN [Halomonas sp. PR-M31]|uniref:flagellar motor switch protein FliN n=1 Tax=Halomonas sp. PR-M31 TaxID=1471202 RepID=UPI00065047C8|nr:flagellar motor switch protein FliN [Halomonas sp. PR-M31]
MTDPQNPDKRNPDQSASDESNPDQNDLEQNSTDDPWAEAMAEQETAEADGQSDSDASTEEDDPWAAAFAEQGEVEPEDEFETPQSNDSAPATAAGDQVFKPLNNAMSSGAVRDLEMIMDIPVKLTVELGRTRITIKQLLELAQGSVIELDGLAGEPMDILINGYLIAQGEVVVVDDKYGIRITEIITPSERVQKLNR